MLNYTVIRTKPYLISQDKSLALSALIRIEVYLGVYHCHQYSVRQWRYEVCHTFKFVWLVKRLSRDVLSYFCVDNPAAQVYEVYEEMIDS